MLGIGGVVGCDLKSIGKGMVEANSEKQVVQMVERCRLSSKAKIRTPSAPILALKFTTDGYLSPMHCRL